jgi:hypothetical protein
MKNSMKKIFNWLGIYTCCGCRKIIFPFCWYYDVSVRLRGMGPFHNQAHCVACHDISVKENSNKVGEDKRCEYCASSAY